MSSPRLFDLSLARMHERLSGAEIDCHTILSALRLLRTRVVRKSIICSSVCLFFCYSFFFHPLILCFYRSPLPIMAPDSKLDDDEMVREVSDKHQCENFLWSHVRLSVTDAPNVSSANKRAMFSFFLKHIKNFFGETGYNRLAKYPFFFKASLRFMERRLQCTPTVRFVLCGCFKILMMLWIKYWLLPVGAVANVLTKKIIRNNFVCLLANLISPSRHSPS